MQSERHVPIEEMEMFERYVEVADWAWHVVENWPEFAADTIGKQLVRAVDSIGANLVEGDGRYGHADAIHFFVIARASARETRYWLLRAAVRKLIPREDVDVRLASLASATKMLNSLITYRRTQSSGNQKIIARDGKSPYSIVNEDPFSVDLD